MSEQRADPEKRAAKLLGGYEVTIYPTGLGELWRTHTVHGPAVKLLGPQAEPCSHIITAQQARDAAAALLEIADEIEVGQPSAVVRDGAAWAVTDATPDHPARAYGPVRVTE